MKEKDPVSLASLYGGAVLEAVDHELQNVLANIQDVNTSPVAASPRPKLWNQAS